MLLVEGELLQVHPAVQRGADAGRDDDGAVRRHRRQDVLFGRAEDVGAALVGEEHVRHPQHVPQRLLAHDGLRPVGGDLFEHEPRVDVAQLEQGVDFELLVVKG